MPHRDDPVVIEVAHDGVADPAGFTHVPKSPKEIAADMLRCLDAGARSESNAELVEEGVALAESVCRRVATPSETDKLFGFPPA